MGTPTTCLPSRSRGGSVDGRSDIYALGVIGYAVLTGRLPFEAPNVQEVLLMHLRGQAPAIREFEPSVPHEVAAALQRCLAKDPAARFSEAGLLRDLLAPGARQEEELPPALANLEGAGVRLLPWAAALLYGLWLERLWGLSATAAAPLRFVLAILALLPLRDLGRVASARKRGFGFASIARAAFRQPRWWPSWYPRPLRAPGDVWDRLPPVTKALRALGALLGIIIAGEVLLVFALLGIPADSLEKGASGSTPATISALTAAVTWTLVFGLALGIAWYNLGKSWAVRRGLDAMDGYRLIVEPAAFSGFWRRPQIARVLSRAETRQAPRSPGEYLSALEQAERALGTAAASRALELARELAQRIASLDAEVRRLGRDATRARPTTWRSGSRRSEQRRRTSPRIGVGCGSSCGSNGT